MRSSVLLKGSPRQMPMPPSLKPLPLPPCSDHKIVHRLLSILQSPPSSWHLHLPSITPLLSSHHLDRLLLSITLPVSPLLLRSPSYTLPSPTFPFRFITLLSSSLSFPLSPLSFALLSYTLPSTLPRHLSLSVFHSFLSSHPTLSPLTIFNLLLKTQVHLCSPSFPLPLDCLVHAYLFRRQHINTTSPCYPSSTQFY